MGLSACTGIRPRHRVPLPLGLPASWSLSARLPLALRSGTQAGGVPTDRRGRLPRRHGHGDLCVRVALAAGRRIDRGQRRASRTGVPRRRPRDVRCGELLDRADRALVRHVPALGVRFRRPVRGPRTRRQVQNHRRPGRLCRVPVNPRRRPDVHGLPMGHVPRGVSLRRGHTRAFARRRHLGAAPLGVSVHVPLRRGETALRRSRVGRPVRARIPFRDAAAADAVRLVRAPVAWPRPGVRGSRDLRHRTRAALLHLRTAQGPRPGSLQLRVPRGAHPRHRQLQLLQPVDDRRVRRAAGRPVPATASVRPRRKPAARVRDGWRAW